MKRRVVVTGIGIISPLGIGIEKNWKGIIEGRSGIRRITRFDATNFPVQIAGEVPDFNPEVFIEKKEIKPQGGIVTSPKPEEVRREKEIEVSKLMDVNERIRNIPR